MVVLKLGIVADHSDERLDHDLVCLHILPVPPARGRPPVTVRVHRRTHVRMHHPIVKAAHLDRNVEN
jgi:hypothetical protein